MTGSRVRELDEGHKAAVLFSTEGPGLSELLSRTVW
jgi:hypothetical protein